MKKIFVGISTIFLFAFFSCKFTMPNNVAVKTSDEADYKFAILNVEKDLNEYFSVDSLKSSISSENISLYSYNPDGNSDTTQLLVKVPIQEIPLDFSEYLDSLNLNDSLSSMSINKSFTVPKVDFSQSQKMDLSEIDDKINALVAFTGISGENEDITFAFNEYSSDSFDSITYSYGAIGVSCPGQTPGSTVTLNTGDVSIRGTFDSNGTAILSSDREITFYKTGMKISFSGQSGLYFGGTISDSSEIKSVKGLTLSNNIKIPLDQTFEVSSDSSLKSCVIGEGILTTNVKFGSSWTGQTLSFDNADISGGLNISDISNGTTDLSGKTFTPENIKVSGDVYATFTNASLDFTDVPNVKVACEITSLESATISLDSNYAVDYSLRQELPVEATKFITSIIWKTSGVKITSSSNLPSGNELKFSTIKSDFFDISKTDTVLTSDGIEIYCADKLETPISTGSAVDFSVSLSLPGYDDTEKTITAKNIVPGSEYSIDINVEPKFDWFKIKVNPSALSTDAQEGKESTGFSIASMFESIDEQLGLSGEDSFANKVELKSVPAYLFCNLPEIFSYAQFSGKIKTYIGDSDANEISGYESSYILGTESEYKNITTSSEPTLVLNDDGEVTTNLNTLGISSSLDFADVINSSKTATEGSICIDYSIKFSAGDSDSMTFVNPEYENEINAGEVPLNVGKDNNISLTAMMVVPFALEITDSFSIDLIKLSNIDRSSETWDLLGRTETPDNSQIEKWFEVIKSMYISYNLTELPFNSDNPLKISIKIPNASNGVVDSSSYLYEETLKFALNDEEKIEIEKPIDFLNAYPLEPEIKLTIPQGNFKIPKDVSLATDVVLGIKTNGETLTFSK